MGALSFEVRDRVGWVQFLRPDQLNSIDEQVLSDLDSVLDHVESDRGIRVLVIRGSGRAFSVGLDVDLLTRAFKDDEYFLDVLSRYHQLLLRLEDMEVPVVGAVNGLARAGGFELLLACDLVIVSEDARIGDNHTGFGVMPGGGSTFRLPARIGEQLAKELIFTARWLSGQQATEIGLALKAVPGDQLDLAVQELCNSLVDKPRPVHGAVKRAIRDARGLRFADAVDVELREFSRYVLAGEEAREGFRAFKEDRDPTWR